MNDIFQNYHRHEMLRHLGILSMSLVLALSINMFVLGGKTGEYLKANVLEGGQGNSIEADIQVIVEGAKLSFVNNKSMSQVSEISFSVTYNPESGKPTDPKSLISGSVISEISNQAGISTYLINFTEAQEIPESSKISSFVFEKQIDQTAYINVMNVNFKDQSGEIYLLSSSGTMF